MRRSPHPKPPPAATSTVAEIAAIVGRGRPYLFGWLKRFELPPGHGNRYPSVYTTLFRTVDFLRFVQIPHEALTDRAVK